MLFDGEEYILLVREGGGGSLRMTGSRQCLLRCVTLGKCLKLFGFTAPQLMGVGVLKSTKVVLEALD